MGLGEVAGSVGAIAAVVGLVIGIHRIWKAGRPQVYAVIRGRDDSIAYAQLIVKNTVTVPILVDYLKPRSPSLIKLGISRTETAGDPWNPQIVRKWIDEYDQLPLGVTLEPGKEHTSDFVILINESSRSISVRMSCQVVVMRRIAKTSRIDVIAVIPELIATNKKDV